MCNDVTKCAAGKKFVAKSGDVAAKCEACASGKFNAKDDNSAACADHNKCTDTAVKTAGDTTKDAVCEPGLGREIYGAFYNVRMDIYIYIYV